MDHLEPPLADPGPEEPTKGLLARARGRLMDLTPLKVSKDFRRLFIGRSISDLGDEVIAVVIPFQASVAPGSGATTRSTPNP
jgi:hypothetical protein